MNVGKISLMLLGTSAPKPNLHRIPWFMHSMCHVVTGVTWYNHVIHGKHSLVGWENVSCDLQLSNNWTVCVGKRGCQQLASVTCLILFPLSRPNHSLVLLVEGSSRNPTHVCIQAWDSRTENKYVLWAKSLAWMEVV